mmetsp:Transcript_12942/g.32813  ORF Transcript_12942/g.32813 Transcript_12942/m.32813 type:complete len:200 (+) Transcript_12942:886-1485(+)
MPVRREGRSDRREVDVRLRLGLDPDERLLLLPRRGGAHFPLRLHLLDHLRVLPPDLGREPPQPAELPIRPEPGDAERVGNHHALSRRELGRDALEDGEAAEGLSAAGGLVGDHAADGAPEDAGGGAEVDGALFGVGVHALAEEGEELALVAEEGAGDVDFFGAHDGDGLAVEELLGDDGGKATEEVASAVDDDVGVGHG